MTAQAVACGLCVAVALLPWTAGGRAARVRHLLARHAPRTDAGTRPAVVDVAVLLGLLDAAIGSGAALPRALGAVGRAVGGPDGEALERAERALVLGAGWDAAWAGSPPRLEPVVTCLRTTWTTGTAPGPVLRAAAGAVVRERRTVAREAAGRLGVRLVLPLGLCFLPAFLLIGLVPVLVHIGSRVAG